MRPSTTSAAAVATWKKKKKKKKTNPARRGGSQLLQHPVWCFHGWRSVVPFHSLPSLSISFSFSCFYHCLYWSPRACPCGDSDLREEEERESVGLSIVFIGQDKSFYNEKTYDKLGREREREKLRDSDVAILWITQESIGDNPTQYSNRSVSSQLACDKLIAFSFPSSSSSRISTKFTHPIQQLLFSLRLSFLHNSSFLRFIDSVHSAHGWLNSESSSLRHLKNDRGRNPTRISTLWCNHPVQP